MSYPPPPSDPTRPYPGEGPVSGQPWSSPSGDSFAAEPWQPPQPPQPPSYQPGYAALPTPNAQAGAPPEGYPATSQFPAQPGQPQYEQPVGYPPPGQYPPPPYQPVGQMQPPGYGPPPGYSPQPGYGAPPPPPKRSNVPLIAVLVAVVVLLCAGGVTSVVLLVNSATKKAQETIESLPTVPTEVPDLPTDLPTGLPTDLPTDLPTGLPNLPDLDPNQVIEVEYDVTGDGPVEIVYLEELGGDPKRVRNASLPWHKKVSMKGSALVSVVAVRGSSSQGTLSCSAKVDGEEVVQKTSEGTFITASCIKVVF